MKVLVEMNDADLLESLRVLPKMYQSWISEQRFAYRHPAEGLEPYDSCRRRMSACELACTRIETGIELLATH